MMSTSRASFAFLLLLALAMQPQSSFAQSPGSGSDSGNTVALSSELIDFSSTKSVTVTATPAAGYSLYNDITVSSDPEGCATYDSATKTITFTTPGKATASAEFVKMVGSAKCDSVTASKTATAFKIDIKRGETVITGATIKVIVGQQIAISAVIAPSSLESSITNPKWSIPGKIVKKYEAEKAKGTLTAISQEDLSNKIISFYWVDGGDSRDVTFSAAIGGQAPSAKATFDVKIPTATVTATPGIVKIWQLEHAAKALSCGEVFNDSPGGGMVFSSVISIPDGFSGKAAWGQIINSGSLRRRQLNDGTWQQDTLMPKGGLDSRFPYSEEADCYDSPHFVLSELEVPPPPAPTVEVTKFKAVEISDSFSMYFIFKPSGEDSIWVPLKVITWGWKGKATRKNAVWAESDLDSHTDPVPSVNDTSDHPTWTSNAGGENWENE